MLIKKCLLGHGTSHADIMASYIHQQPYSATHKGAKPLAKHDLTMQSQFYDESLLIKVIRSSVALHPDANSHAANIGIYILFPISHFTLI